MGRNDAIKTQRHPSTLVDYLEYHDTYQGRYKNSVVLMNVGIFYEIYTVHNEELGLSDGPDIYQLGEHLNVHVTRKSKSNPVVSYANSLMIGFPDIAFLKYMNLLIELGYTVIRVDQLSKGPNPKREVTEIYSPGTMLETGKGSDTNHLLSIYLSLYIQHDHNLHICVGVSAIDVGTGKNYVHSIHSNFTEDLWINEVYRLIHTYSPSETLIHFDEKELQKFSKDHDMSVISKGSMCQRWELNEATCNWNILDNAEFHRPNYQNAFYGKLYPERGILTPLEYMGFEREREMTLAHLHMMEHIYAHKVENVQEIKRPTFQEPREHMSLTHNSMYQLNLVDTKEHMDERYSSLITLLNKCKTAMGRRLCKERLLQPIIDPRVLAQRYSQIEGFQRPDHDGKTLGELCQSPFHKVLDMEKLYRMMSLQRLDPYGFYGLHQCYHFMDQARHAISEIYPEFLEEFQDCLETLSEHRETYADIFEMSEIEKYSLLQMETSVFKTNIVPEIDRLDQVIKESFLELQTIADKLGTYIVNKDDVVKVDHTETRGHHLLMTNTRSKILKTKLRNMGETTIYFKHSGSVPFFSCSAVTLTSCLRSKGGKEILMDHPYISEVSNRILTSQIQLVSLNKKHYLKYLGEMYQRYHKTFETFVDFVSLCDLNACIAKISMKHVYCRPTLDASEDQEDQSFVDAKQLRHPLVERIQTDIPYKPNDITLSESGILLYGTNACGKSTLMKSLGLAIIMAQAGFFVPCESFRYSPYTQMFTRILNTDNLFQGQSSFAVEMSELRHILQRANHRSMVLGDEVCSGTETVSAKSIVGAGLKMLSDKKSSFIFTSHIHELMEIQKVKDIPNMVVKHLKIDYDETTGTLTYDRTLVDGSGPPIYGLVVCQALDLGSDFISLAKQIKLEITGESETFVNAKPSSYNSAIKMDQCRICGSKENLEHHHIQEQQEADENGNIGHFHKNIAHNGVVLCASCHTEHHHGNIEIQGYQQTTQGKVLKVAHLTPETKPKNDKKFTKDVDTVLLYKEKREQNISVNQCLRDLEVIHGIKMGRSVFNQIMAGTY
jgi:DNA mismatch repair protein MutS